MIIFLLLAVVLLTYSNGANDNFKGVATLWGSRTLSYRSALVLATVATFAGSFCSWLIAEELIKNFSGKGLVPESITHSLNFVLSVALASGVTVLLATRFGFPVSTTHGLVGGLVGAGLVASTSGVDFVKLGKIFFMPLLISPLAAVVLSTVIYRFMHKARTLSGITEESCLCVGESSPSVTLSQNAIQSATAAPLLTTTLANQSECISKYQGVFMGISFQPVLNLLHCTSAAAVSFARGLNDTPKLVSLLLITKLFSIPVYSSILAVAMAAGGLLNAKKVASTMSNKISQFNHGQGFTANFITAFLVIGASKFGMPVSTTHVSVGSIYGIGLVNQTANNKEISKILLSWLLVLPLAGGISALSYALLEHLKI